MHFFQLIAVIVIVVQFSSTIVAQNWECTVEQYEYAPNKGDQFCVFRSVEWKKGRPEPEISGSTASKVAFVDSSFASIPDSFFNKFPQLEILVAQNGTLKELSIKNRMKIVHAEKNQITSLRIEGSGMMLKELHIQDNPLTNIDTIVRSLKGLEVLDLSKTAVADNSDGTIDLSLFASLPNLTELYVTYMEASYVENEIQATLPKLKLLDLSGNLITPSNFRLRVFRSIPNLEELYLRDTVMSDLSVTDIREDLPSLKRLYFDGNNLRCDLLEALLAHCKERGIEMPSQFRTCYLGYDSLEGLCCVSFIRDVPKNGNQGSVSNPPKDTGIVTNPPKDTGIVSNPPKDRENSTTSSTTTSNTVDTRTKEHEPSNESNTTNKILLYVGIAVAVLLVVAIVVFFIVKQKKKHQKVPTNDNAMHDDL